MSNKELHNTSAGAAKAVEVLRRAVEIAESQGGLPAGSKGGVRMHPQVRKRLEGLSPEVFTLVEDADGLGIFG